MPSRNTRSRKQMVGTCRLCGTVGPLSFEHVPPRSAFNDQPVMALANNDIFSIGPDDEVRGRIQQRGAGGYTLCARCNAKIGRWYGDAHKQWVLDSANILRRSGGVVSLVHLNHVLPLRVLKQVAAMFFSVNPLGFADRNPELVRFILNPHSQFLPRGLRFFVYYNWEGRYRAWPVAAILNIRTGESSTFSEITHPPLGYVMTIESGPPDERMCEITEWTRYPYSAYEAIPLKIPVLPTHTFIGGDYRTKEQVYQEARREQPRSA